MAACQVAGFVGAALMLPSALIDSGLDTDFLSILLQVVLAAFAGSLIVGA